MDFFETLADAESVTRQERAAAAADAAADSNGIDDDVAARILARE